jgi:hypothetical protein
VSYCVPVWKSTRSWPMTEGNESVDFRLLQSWDEKVLMSVAMKSPAISMQRETGFRSGQTNNSNVIRATVGLGSETEILV